MPKRVRPLTDTQIRRGLKPTSPGEITKTADGRGLYLNVSDGGRWWSWRGTVHGRRVELGIGALDLVPPSEARTTAIEWQRIAKAGGDPRQVRDAHRGAKVTFEQAARTVWARDVEGIARNAKAATQWITSLETYVFPKIGRRPIAGVRRADVKAVLDPIWKTKPETARRVRQRIGSIFAYAIGQGYYTDASPVDRELTRSLDPHKREQEHHSRVGIAELPATFARIEGVKGSGARALAFGILTAARPGEVRGATWEEIDFDAGLWTIPGARMKAGREHIVPLSPAAIAILRGVPRADRFVFASSKRGAPISNATMAAVLKRLGVEATVHGFRSTFRDWVEINDVGTEAGRELALAHVNTDATRAAYQRDGLVEQRRTMMARWAEFATGTEGAKKAA